MATKYKRTFTIDRAKWRAGGAGAHHIGEGRTAMLNAAGFMCCLGHIAKQCGFSDAQLVDRGLPDAVVLDPAQSTGFLTELSDNGDVCNTALTLGATKYNDNEYWTLAVRESRLRDLFAEHGYRIKFVGRANNI